jgi:hypothetical protein
VYVQVQICEKWTKTKPKPTKTSTRMEKGQKPELGKLNGQGELKMSKQSSKIHKVARKVPGQSLKKLATSVLILLDIDKIGHLKKYLKKKSTLVLHKLKNVNLGPWNKF